MTQFVDIPNYIRANWQMIADGIGHGTLNEDVCEESARSAILPHIRPRPKRAAELMCTLALSQKGIRNGPANAAGPDGGHRCFAGKIP